MSTETERSAEPRPKRIVVCMDGTWNSPAVAKMRDDGDEVFKPSNVLKTARAVKTLDDTLGTLMFDGPPKPGETVTLGGKVYTFATELDDRDGVVSIGDTASKSLDNLAFAVDLRAHRGRYGASTTRNERVTARDVPGGAGGLEILARRSEDGEDEPLSFACGVERGRWIGSEKLQDEARNRGLDPLGGVPQVSFYDPGVGGARSFPGISNAVHRTVDRAFGGARGAGFEANIEDAYLFLSLNFNPGDELYLFGFSRGASSVRSLARFLEWVGGVIPARDSYWIPRIFDAYLTGAPRVDELLETIRERIRKHLLERRRYSEERASREASESVRPVPVRISFLGVWDTVLSLGEKRDRLHLRDTPPASADRVYQALAVDEQRPDFLPWIWRRPAHDEQQLVQRWFAGVHTNVGGGYVHDGLANIPLRFLLQGAREAGLGIDWEFLRFYMPYGRDTLYDSRDSWVWRALETVTRRKGKGVRKIEIDPDAGLHLHPSALERIAALKEEDGRVHERFEPYRPKNLLSFLAAHDDLDRLLTDVLGSDAEPDALERIRRAVREVAG